MIILQNLHCVKTVCLSLCNPPLHYSKCAVVLWRHIHGKRTCIVTALRLSQTISSSSCVNTKTSLFRYNIGTALAKSSFSVSSIINPMTSTLSSGSFRSTLPQKHHGQGDADLSNMSSVLVTIRIITMNNR